MLQKQIKTIARNYTKGRESVISEITIHHTASTSNLDHIWAWFNKPEAKASSHYAIKDDQIMQYVMEEDTAWANSNRQANHRAITIEVVNSKIGEPWLVSGESIITLMALINGVAKRHDLYPLKLGENLTWHNMYSKTICPGPYLQSRLAFIATTLNAINTKGN